MRKNPYEKVCICRWASAIASALTLGARPAAAQLGGLTGALNTAAKVKKIADLKVTDAEERQIGQAGQRQDGRDVRRLPGRQRHQVRRRWSGRCWRCRVRGPDLDWQFVVLDTEGVNAFAAPGGFIHITKGLLGLMKDEAELAGVLAHEIIHVTEKHTVNAIQNGDSIKVLPDEVGSSGGMARVARHQDRRARPTATSSTTSSAATTKARPTKRASRSPTRSAMRLPASSSALTKLSERNKDAKEPNGLFASHPQMKDRIAKIDRLIKERKLARRRPFSRATPRTSPSTPSRRREWRRSRKGHAGSLAAEEKKPADTKTADAEKKEEPKKSGGMFSKLEAGRRLAGAAVADRRLGRRPRSQSRSRRRRRPEQEARASEDRPERHRRVPEGDRA